jgi:hypothetical protein
MLQGYLQPGSNLESNAAAVKKLLDGVEAKRMTPTPPNQQMSSSVAARLHEAETLTISLHQKNASLEAEYKDFKERMHMSILQYKRYIAQLKTQLDAYTGSASGTRAVPAAALAVLPNHGQETAGSNGAFLPAIKPTPS